MRALVASLTFLEVVWHGKIVFGMYVKVLQFLTFFDGVGMKKHCHFSKPLDQLLLSAWNHGTFSSGQKFSIFYHHGSIVQDASGFAD